MEPVSSEDIQDLIDTANLLISSLDSLLASNRPESSQTIGYYATRIYLQLLVLLLEYIRDWLIALENIQAVIGTDFEGQYQEEFLSLYRMQEIDTVLQSCGTQLDIVCIVNQTIPVPEIYDAIRQELIDGIKIQINNTMFDGTGFTSEKLATAYKRLLGCSPSYDLVCLIGLVDTYQSELFPVEQSIRDRWLNQKFQEIFVALQANPTTNIDTMLMAYRTAIQNAYGVTFSTSGGNAIDWTLASLHFAHLGFDATARAFEGWAESYATQQSIAITINRYDLFRRIMGNMQFTNSDLTRSNFAISDLGNITIYQRPKNIQYYVYENSQGITQYVPFVNYPDNTENEELEGYTQGNGRRQTHPQFQDNTYLPGKDKTNPELLVSDNPRRQAIMTPNNLVHELGHSFSRFAGFGFEKIGSMEQAIQDTGLPTTRDGMGPTYLRELFYEHAQVIDNNGTAQFNILTGKEPSVFAPSGYLLYDIFQTKYALWGSPYNILGSNARIDTGLYPIK